MTSLQAEPNLLVLRSFDIHRAVEFYQLLGLSFELHAHGKGPDHYAAEFAGFAAESPFAPSRTPESAVNLLGSSLKNLYSVCLGRGNHGTIALAP